MTARAAVCQSPARRVLVPINHCENIVVGVPAEVVRINNKAVNPADDLDQQDLPDVMAQRLTELDRRISRLEKDAQGDVPPSIHEVIQKQQR